MYEPIIPSNITTLPPTLIPFISPPTALILFLPLIPTLTNLIRTLTPHLRATATTIYTALLRATTTTIIHAALLYAHIPPYHHLAHCIYTTATTLRAALTSLPTRLALATFSIVLTLLAYPFLLYYTYYLRPSTTVFTALIRAPITCVLHLLTHGVGALEFLATGVLTGFGHVEWRNLLIWVLLDVGMEWEGGQPRGGYVRMAMKVVEGVFLGVAVAGAWGVGWGDIWAAIGAAAGEVAGVLGVVAALVVVIGGMVGGVLWAEVWRAGRRWVGWWRSSHGGRMLLSELAKLKWVAVEVKYLVGLVVERVMWWGWLFDLDAWFGDNE